MREQEFIRWLQGRESGCTASHKTITTVYAENIGRIERRITDNFEMAIRGQQQTMINLDALEKDDLIRLYHWFEYSKEDELACRPPRQHIRTFGLNKNGSTEAYQTSINWYSVFRGLGNLLEDN